LRIELKKRCPMHIPIEANFWLRANQQQLCDARYWGVARRQCNLIPIYFQTKTTPRLNPVSRRRIQTDLTAVVKLSTRVTHAPRQGFARIWLQVKINIRKVIFAKY
jgi:hypothetical protein